jgi:hypothetical protein
VITATHNPDRDAGSGQFYIELVKTDFGADAPPRELWSRLGFVYLKDTVVAQYAPGRWVTVSAVGKTGSAVAP